MYRYKKRNKQFLGQLSIFGVKLIGLVGISVVASWLSLKTFETFLLIFILFLD